MCLKAEKWAAAREGSGIANTRQHTLGEELGPDPQPASDTAAPPEAGYSLKEELEEEEEFLLHPRTAARAEVHWDEASTDGEESEGELEVTGRG